MKNLKGKGLLTILLALTMLIASASMVFAAAQTFVVKTDDGKFYEYNQDALNLSYTAFQMDETNPAAAMYKQFKALDGDIVAMQDSEKGYMDFQAAQTAFIKAQMAGETFDINAYFASAEAVPYADPVTDPIVVDPAGDTHDLTAYNAAVADAASKVEADYTAASWANLQTVLAANVVTAADTQARIDEAAGAINAAIAALEPAVVGIHVTDVTAINTAAVDGATNVLVNEQFTVTFSGLITESTANINTIKLETAAGVQAAATYSYNAQTKQVLVRPNALLAENTAYTLKINDGVKAADGTTAVIAKTVSFTTGTSPVVRTLTVSATAVNTDGQANPGTTTVAAGDEITAVFNKDIDASTLTTSTFKVYDQTNANYIVASGITYNAAAKTARFTVGSPATTTNAKFEVQIEGVKTLDGTAVAKFTRTFVKGSLVTPSLQALSPASPNVYSKLVSATVNGTFLQGFRLNYTIARQMDSSTLNANTVQIREQGSTTGIPATVTHSNASGLLTIVPASDLKDSTVYTVWFDVANIKDSIGLPITAPVTTFTTGDYTNPTVTATTPANSATSIVETDAIRITMSEAVNPTTVVGSVTNAFGAGASVVLVDSDNVAKDISGAVTLENGNKTIVITTSGLALSRNTTYTVKLHGGSTDTVIRDTANVNGSGLALAENYEFSFTTRAADTVAPKLVNVKQGTTEITAGMYVVGATTDIAVTFDKALALSAGTIFTLTDMNASTSAVETAATTVGSNTVTVANSGVYHIGDRVLLNGGAIANQTRAITAIPDGTHITVDGAALAASAGNVSITRVAATFSNTDVSLSNGNKTITIPLTGGLRLANDRMYKLTITDTLIKDTATPANTYAGSSNLNFTTGAKPAVDKFNATTQPQPLASNVAVNVNPVVVITDDIGVQDTSINATTVKLIKKSDSSVIPTTIGLAGTATSRTVTLTTSGNLDASTQYAIVVSGVKDTAGNTIADTEYTFTTTDTAAPTVSAITPANNESGVATNSKVTITFDKAMDASTFLVNDSNIMVEKTDGTDVIFGNSELSYNSGTRTLTITPATPFAPSTTYRVKVGTSVKASTGVAVATTINNIFSTSTDAASGSISSFIWNDAATVGAWDTNDSLVITFKAPLNRAHRTGTITAVNFGIGPFVPAITGTIAATSTELVVSNATNLTVGMKIRVAGAGNLGNTLDTHITGITGDNVTVALAAETAVTDAVVTQQGGYDASATTITVDDGTTLIAGDTVKIAGGATLTVASVTGNVVTFTTAVGATVNDNAVITGSDPITVGKFTVGNGSFSGLTPTLTADRTQVVLPYAGGSSITTITTVAPVFNAIVDTNGAPLETTAVTVTK